eukprot:5175692-Prymnesium_polylepis.1
MAVVGRVGRVTSIFTVPYHPLPDVHRPAHGERPRRTNARSDVPAPANAHGLPGEEHRGTTRPAVHRPA